MKIILTNKIITHARTTNKILCFIYANTHIYLYNIRKISNSLIYNIVDDQRGGIKQCT